MTRSGVLARDVPAQPSRRDVVSERCDRCCAAAVVHVVVRSGLDLAFCAHHARKHQLELDRSGALVVADGRDPSLYW